MTGRRLASLVLVLLDFGCVVLVFHAVGWARGLAAVGTYDLPTLLVPAGVLCLAIYLIDGYSPRTDMISVAYTSQHVIALTVAMLAMLLVTFGLIKGPYALHASRAVIALSYIALMPVTLAYRRWLTLRILSRREHRPILFLGNQASCINFKATCRENGLAHEVIFIAIDAASHESITPLIDLEMRTLAELPPLLDQVAPRLEAVVLHESSRDLPSAVSERLTDLHFRGTPTYTLALFHEVYWRKIPLEQLNQIWLFQEGFQIAREPVFARLKRLSDVVCALLGLTLASPLLLLCAAAVWLEDRGPVFYRQTRIGKNRVPFQICKFRTMRPDAEKGDPYTHPQDARITRVGRWLRAARLDEFPQLWNVLRGHMSLIGPRAEWSKLVDRYERDIPCYHFRHLMKPGITGWAQVNYPYGGSLEDTLRKLEYDLYYVRYFSFVLDASIVLKTVHIMLFGKGR